MLYDTVLTDHAIKNRFKMSKIYLKG